jgi:hypothetical protein
VTPEAKIRQLCTRLLAAENDEGSKRILHELRVALHKNWLLWRALMSRDLSYVAQVMHSLPVLIRSGIECKVYGLVADAAE